MLEAVKPHYVYNQYNEEKGPGRRLASHTWRLVIIITIVGLTTFLL